MFLALISISMNILILILKLWFEIFFALISKFLLVALNNLLRENQFINALF
jgi:hypothetical protein